MGLFSSKSHKHRCVPNWNPDDPPDGYCGKRWGEKVKDPGQDHMDYVPKKCPECRSGDDDSSSTRDRTSVGGVGVSSGRSGSSDSGGRPTVQASDVGDSGDS